MINFYNEFVDADMCRALVEQSKTICTELKTYDATKFISMQDYYDSQRESGHFIDSVRGNRTQIFFDRNDKCVLPIREKISKLTNSPIEHQTRPLVMMYNEGGNYRNHYDYIDRPGQGGQRLKSILIYLNNDYEGGLTYFEHHKLFVNPEVGKLLIFDNTIDEFYKFVGKEKFYRKGKNESVRHESLPVRKGSKYVLVIWIREDVPLL